MATTLSDWINTLLEDHIASAWEYSKALLSGETHDTLHRSDFRRQNKPVYTVEYRPNFSARHNEICLAFTFKEGCKESLQVRVQVQEVTFLI